MSDQKHTPEPWHTDEEDEVVMLLANPTGKPGGNRELGALYGTWSDANANARRIVACVNACAGLDTGLLENIVDLGDSLRSRFDSFGRVERELTKQRDDLMNACEGMIAWDKKTGLRVPYKVRDPIHEAISSVKGGAA